MSQEKAQLIAPLGNMTVPGVTATGVITATSFEGNIAGSATSIKQGSSVSAGVVTASSFVGNLTGNIQRLADSGPNISVGVVTATSFSGNLTGSVTDLTGTPTISVGVVTATRLQGAVTGDVTGDVTGNVSGVATGNVTGTVSGIAQGGLGVNYNGGWPGAGTSQISAGVVTATSFYGDGSNLDGVSSGPVSAQSVTANSGTTAIDLSNGNLIYMTQSADTTVSFANSENGNVYIIRTKDDNTTARTITWPTGIGWSGGSAPTLLTNPRATDAQVFLLTTRDEGETWYGKEVVRSDPQTYELWTAGRNMGSVSANNVPSNPAVSISSPTQVGGSSALWSMVGDSMDGYNYVATKADGTLWSWGYNQYGSLGLNENSQKYSSPVQVGTDNDWDAVRTTYSSVMVTKTDGSIWVWGNNTQGQLGLNDTVHRSSPIQFAGADVWTWTTMGNRNGVGTKSDGTLWTWGNGDDAALGRGSTNHCSSPAQVPGTTWDTSEGGCRMGGDIVVAKKTDGNLWAWGKNQSRGLLGINVTSPGDFSSPKQVPGTWTDCVIGQCRSGFNGILVAKSSGEIYMSGTNSEGQYGNNSKSPGSPGGMVETCNGKQFDPKVTKGMANFALSTDYKILAADSNGQIWIWGAVAYGEAGNNTNSDDGGPMAFSSPTQIPGKTGFDQFMWAGGSWVGRKQG